MTTINPNTKLYFVLVIFAILMTFFGAVFGGIINTVDKDNYNKNKDTYTGIAITSIVLVALLGIISFVGISKDPTIFGPYVLITTHLSLLLSILSVTFASFKL
jgi:hypothetical protein